MAEIINLTTLKIGESYTNSTNSTSSIYHLKTGGFKYEISMQGVNGGGLTSAIVDFKNFPTDTITLSFEHGSISLSYGEFENYDDLLYYRFLVAGGAGDSSYGGGIESGNPSWSGHYNQAIKIRPASQTSGGVVSSSTNGISFKNNGKFGYPGVTSGTVYGTTYYVAGGYGWYGGGSIWAQYDNFVYERHSISLDNGGSGFIIGQTTTEYPSGYMGDDQNLISTIASSISEAETIYGYNTDIINSNVFSIKLLDKISGICGDNAIWSLDEDTLTISGTGNMYDSGDYGWESYISNITNIIINSGINYIGERAFLDFDNLTSVTIPDSVTSIGGWAFDGCTSLTNVYINDLSKWCTINFEYPYSSNPLYYARNIYIGGDHNPVTELVIPIDVQTISSGAFYNCSINSLIIPNNVIEIGSEAFRNCTKLTTLIFEENSVLTNIGHASFYNCFDLSNINIPDSVTSIGNEAFKNCALKTVILGNSIKSIGSYAFNYSSNIIFYEDTEEKWNLVEKSELDSQIYFYSENIPETEGNYWYYKGDLVRFWSKEHNITYHLNGGINSENNPETYNEEDLPILLYTPDSEYDLFKGWYLDENFETYISEIPVGSTTDISLYAKWEEVYLIFELSDNQTFYSIKGFINGREKEDVLIPNTYNSKPVKRIEENSFKDKDIIKKISIQSLYLNIDKYAFSGCINLEEIKFVSNGSILIDEYSFERCESLKEIMFPSTDTFISEYAFSNCKNLKIVRINVNTGFAYSTSFIDCDSLERFASTTGSNEGTSLRIIDGNLYYYPDGASLTLSKYCSGKKEKIFNIPEGVISIERYAIQGNTSLEEINIPNSVENLYKYWCIGATNVKRIIIPESIDYVDENGFSGLSPKNIYISSREQTNKWNSNWNINYLGIIRYGNNISIANYKTSKGYQPTRAYRFNGTTWELLDINYKDSDGFKRV